MAGLDLEPNAYMVAWPLTAINLNGMEDFVDRWATWFAEASQNQLKRPVIRLSPEPKIDTTGVRPKPVFEPSEYPEDRNFRATIVASFVVLAMIVGVVAWIVHSVRQSDEAAARQAATFATEEADLETKAKGARLDCFVVGGPLTGRAMIGLFDASNRFPCSAIPLGPGGGSYAYWVTITVVGVSYQRAVDHKMTLDCKWPDPFLPVHDASSGDFLSLTPQADLRLAMSGEAGGANYTPVPIDCEIRTDGGRNIIRTIHVTVAIDPSRHFEA